MSAVSERAKANERKRNRENYEWYKAHGICPKCKNAWAAPGRVFCEPCLKQKLTETMRFGGEYNARKCKERRERLKEKGLCVRCARPAVEGKVLCASCARRNAETQQAARIRKRIEKENAKGVQHGKGNNP